MMERYQFDAAHVTLVLAQVITMMRIEERLEGIEHDVMRQATALELIAGKRGIIYTRDANGV
jgi:hypothetical protein